MAKSVVTGPVVSPAQRSSLGSWTGRRVVLRHLLPDGRATDVLGTLLAVGEDHLTVRADSDGRETTVDHADVVATKPVPPRPPRRDRTAGPGAGPAGQGTGPSAQGTGAGTGATGGSTGGAGSTGVGAAGAAEGGGPQTIRSAAL